MRLAYPPCQVDVVHGQSGFVCAIVEPLQLQSLDESVLRSRKVYSVAEQLFMHVVGIELFNFSVNQHFTRCMTSVVILRFVNLGFDVCNVKALL